MAEYERVKISDEEIGRMLDERPGGRKAGRGDSPYTQEEYERLYGLNGKGNDVEVRFVMDDWILADVLDDPFYNFKWFADFAKSKMKPLVKKYSLPRELVIKAAEVVLWSFIFQDDIKEQKKRIKFIIAKSMDDSLDRKYEKQPLVLGDVRFTQKEFSKFYYQAKTRFFNLMESLDKLDDGGDEDRTERVMTRNQAFECSYLCLRAEDPEEAFYILWGLIDQYQVWLKPMMDKYFESQGEKGQDI